MLRNALPQINTELPGPKAAAVLNRRAQAVPDAIRCPYPCVISRGEGAMIEDVDGNLFLDWVGGVGVLNVGYGQPSLIQAASEQLTRYFHAMMNIVTHEGYVALAEKMNEIVPARGAARKTMFVNSGAEALENAVKVAREYTGRPNIIVFSGAFHGRTLLTAAMTAKKAYAVGAGPFPDGVYRAEFANLYRKPEGYTDGQAIDYYIGKLKQTFIEATPPEQTAAVVVEPVQGEGGFVPAPMEWVKALRDICDEHGILLIADEVQTGFARSGRMFVSDYWAEAGCAPDIVTTAKSIAGGIPLSAVTADAVVFDAVRPGTIGGTYGGNPVACASALRVIELIQKENLCARALAISERVKARWEGMKKKYEQVGDVRGIGCMTGVEFVTDKASKTPDARLVNDVIQYAVKRGLILESAGTYGNVIRFLSPLVITDAQLERGLDILEEAVAACIRK